MRNKDDLLLMDKKILVGNPLTPIKRKKILVWDNFNRPNQSGLGTPNINKCGTTWEEDVGSDWQIVSSTAQDVTFGYGKYFAAKIETNTSDNVEIKLDVTYDNDELTAAIIFRNNLYFGRFYAHSLQIRDGATVLASTSITRIPWAGWVYNLKVSFIGQNIVGTYYDNNSITKTLNASTASNLTETKCGMYRGSSPFYYPVFDNFLAYSL
jgi:hypothetical protein